MNASNLRDPSGLNCLGSAFVKTAVLIVRPRINGHTQTTNRPTIHEHTATCC